MRCLERKSKATQHNRKHNTTRPKQLFFKEKIAASGGTQTHDRPLARRRSYQLSHRVAGLESHIQYEATKAPQPKYHKPDKQVNYNLV